jgi:hypothetical protein
MVRDQEPEREPFMSGTTNAARLAIAALTLALGACQASLDGSPEASRSP